MNYKLSPDHNGLSKALDIIEEKLNYYKLDRKDIAKSMLASEEVMNALFVCMIVLPEANIIPENVFALSK